MKKSAAFILEILLSVFFVSNTYAKTLILTYDGSIHQYSNSIYDLKVKGDIISTDIPPIIINNSLIVPAKSKYKVT